MQKFFKSGEFAKLCGTTKDTLFHYDDIGLLKPIQIAPNGYRYYSINQVFTFDMISIFKEVGMSLEEIKDYLENQGAQNFLTMLKEQDKKMREEIERLKRLRKLLNNTIKITEDAFHVETDKIEFIQKPQEYFIVTPGEYGGDEKAMFQAMFEHIDFCNKHNYHHSFGLGEIIGAESIADKTFKTLYYCTRIDKRVNNKHLHLKPAGQYAIKYIHSSYSNLVNAYADFCHELEEMNCKILGHLYEEDMLNHLAGVKIEDYLMKIEVRVER